MKKIFPIIAILILIFLSSRSYCQAKPSPDTTSIIKLKNDLNIDISLAFKVSEAMHLNENKIATLIKKQDLPPPDKQKQFLLLIHEREEKVNSLLSPEQQELLSRAVLNYIGKKHLMRQDSISAIKDRERSYPKQNSDRTNR
jgi:hypothetical protein